MARNWQSWDSSRRCSTAVPESLRKETKNALGCLLKGHAAFLTGENYVLSSLLWEHWHRRETFAPPDSPWAASVLIFQGH